MIRPFGLRRRRLSLGLLLLARTCGAVETPDHSWATADYLRLGVPDPGRLWVAKDYRDCRDALLRLDLTNRAALPRIDSPVSAAVFARIVNPTNTAFLAPGVLPTPERIQLLSALMNVFPAFLNLYWLTMIDPAFHHEAFELHHAYLRLLRTAVELDGKSVPVGPGEAGPAVMHLTEFNRSVIESINESDAEASRVPRSDRFGLVGAACAQTIAHVLPWLADGSGVPLQERIDAARYLREEVPALWVHILPESQREALKDLEAVLHQTYEEGVRQQLQALNRELRSPGERNSK